jgi:RND family efflux transporter MFP subunit
MTRYWILGLVLLTAACSGAADDAESAAAPVALVKLAPVTQGAAGAQLTLYGAAEPGPAGKMSLVAPAEATVASIDAPTGTAVGRGQIVVRLAASPTLRADAVKAGSDAAAADKALARAIRLRADGLGSDADVETARAAAIATGALRASFANRTGALALRAPAPGIVDTVAVARGDLLQPGAAVASITRKGDVRARFGLDPDAAQTLRPGMAVTIAGIGARAPITVAIQSVSSTVDSQTKLASVFVHLPPGSGVIAGQTLTATADVGGTSAALTIPYAALLDDGGQSYVYAVTGGVAHRRDITTKPSSGGRITVVGGLKAGDQVVVEGGTAVEDGMKVRTR